MGNLPPIAFVILSRCAPFVGGLGLLGARCAAATKIEYAYENVKK
jgi:hypothetical protein